MGGNYRRHAEKLYDFKYRRVRTIGNLCAYCGDPATVIDHIPPISLAHLYKEGHIKVPSCRSCNRNLWAVDIIDLQDRKAYLVEKLLKKYKWISYVGKEYWTDKRLDELEPGCSKKYIKKSVYKERRLKQKYQVLISDESFILDDLMVEEIEE